MRPLRFLLPLAVIGIAVALYLALMVAPTEAVMGDVQRIFYFHVPSAWVGFLAFFVVFVASILHLSGRGGDPRRWDMIASCSAEIGVLFTTIVLITGPIWAKPAWGVYWTWEPKLTSALILWFIYIAYVMLRGIVDEEVRRGRYSAVLGIVGFVDVPIVFFAIRWWGTIAHPGLFKAAGGAGAGGLAPAMKLPFFFSLVAFTILYLALLTVRVQVERDRQRLVDLTHRLQEG
jgi:heme exporter protein C